jgi:hypothetical protein
MYILRIIEGVGRKYSYDNRTGFLLTANLSTLDEGVQKIQFDNIINEFLSDRGVRDSVTKEAMIFQYTYWPQPQNQTMILRRTVDVSYLPLLCVHVVF